MGDGTMLGAGVATGVKPAPEPTLLVRARTGPAAAAAAAAAAAGLAAVAMGGGGATVEGLLRFSAARPAEPVHSVSTAAIQGGE